MGIIFIVWYQLLAIALEKFFFFFNLVRATRVRFAWFHGL